MTEPSRRRGSVLLPVLIAAVFLAVIGGSVGLVLGLRDRDQGASGSGDGGTGTAYETTQQPQTRPGGGISPSPTRKTTRHPSPAQPTSTGKADACRDQIGPNAGAKMTQVLYLRTASYEVWICRDSTGGLSYQGHRGGPDERPIVSHGDDWLFLSGVKQKGDSYVAVNDAGEGSVTYEVSSKGILIVSSKGVPEEELAIASSG